MANPKPNIEGLKANAGRFARLPKDKLREIQSKAGKQSQLIQREQRGLKEQLRAALQLPINNRKLRKEIIADGYEPTQAGNLIRNVVQRAGKNAMMFRTLAEILGELQPQQINVNVLANMSDAELQKKIDSITIEQDIEPEP